MMMIAMETLAFTLVAYHLELVPETLNVFLTDTEGIFESSLSLYMNDYSDFSVLGIGEGLNVLLLHSSSWVSENLFVICARDKCKKLTLFKYRGEFFSIFISVSHIPCFDICIREGKLWN